MPSLRLNRWLRSARAGRAQYFEARLGPFKAGDTVQYSVSCACAGRVVPSGANLRQASSSFRVTESDPN